MLQYAITMRYSNSTNRTRLIQCVPDTVFMYKLIPIKPYHAEHHIIGDAK